MTRPVSNTGVCTRSRAEVLHREHCDLLRAMCAVAALVPAAGLSASSTASGGAHAP